MLSQLSVEKIRKIRSAITEGGEGSGNYGHSGRPGEVGGSGEGGRSGESGGGSKSKESVDIDAADCENSDGEKDRIRTIVKKIPPEDLVGLKGIYVSEKKKFEKTIANVFNETLKATQGYRIVGCYIEGKIYLCEEFSQEVIHEIGHHVWHERLSLNDRFAWKEFYETAREEVNAGTHKWLTSFCSKSVEEYFCEHYQTFYNQTKIKLGAGEQEFLAGRYGKNECLTIWHKVKQIRKRKYIEPEIFTSWQQERLNKGIPEEVVNRANDPEQFIKAMNDPKDVQQPKGVIVVERRISESQRQGMCYELIGRFVIDNPHWITVHATLYPRLGLCEDEIYFHAFAEKGNIIYDAVFDKFYDKNEYYKYYSITDEHKYDSKTLCLKTLCEKHWGPWD